MAIEMMVMGLLKWNKKKENLERQQGRKDNKRKKKKIPKKAHHEFFKFSLFDFGLA